MAEALYRKYRPQIFEDVVGQEHIERTLKNAIEQDKVSHAYLFTGPRGTGKTTTARLLAKALLCQKGPTSEPDGTCEDCDLIAQGQHPDVYELDAASRTGVENVREEIISRVQFAPTRGRYKVYIIDEVHMLSAAAFNALLKTLEEPPSHIVFILATTDPQKVPDTIHSRCQRFDFRRISNESIVSRLGAICVAEDVEFEGEALDLIALRSEGGLRNALTSLEQLIAFGEGRVTLDVAERMLGGIDNNDFADIVQAIGKRDVAACFSWTAEFVETGADMVQCARDLALHVRNLYVMSLTNAEIALEVGDTQRRQLEVELKLFGPDQLARLLNVLGDLLGELKTSTNARLSFEIALTRMVRPESDLTLEALAQRIEELERAKLTVAMTPPALREHEAPAVSLLNPMSDASDLSQASQKSQPAFQSDREPAVQESPVSLTVNEAGQPTNHVADALQNPATLQRIWHEAQSSLKRFKSAYGVLFLNTKAVFDAQKNIFYIEFPAENAFAYKAVQKQDIQDAVASALTQTYGAPLPFAYTQKSSGVSQESGVSSHSASIAQAASQPLVKQQPKASQKASVTPKSGYAESSPLQQTSSVVSVQQKAAQVEQQAPSQTQDRQNYDEVPLDAYDVPPYEEEYVPYGDYDVPTLDTQAQQSVSDVPVQGSSTNSVQARQTQTGHLTVPPWEMPPAQRQESPQGVIESQAQTSQNSDQPLEGHSTSNSTASSESLVTANDLRSMLAADFGEGVVVDCVQD